MVNSMDVLKAENINFGYGSHKILKNVNFEMNNEEVIGLFGDSGSGKSTLCKILTGFIKEFDGNVIAAKTGYVSEAGCCAASYYEADNGKRYICVTANSFSSWRAIYDHVAIYRSLTD